MKYKPRDHTAAFASAFLILSLFLIGIFYIVLWVLYVTCYKQADAIGKNHLKQALIASSICTSIFLLIVIYIVATGGLASLSALITLESYFMFIVPLFLVIGILAFVKAVNFQDFRYPIISRFITFEKDAESSH